MARRLATIGSVARRRDPRIVREIRENAGKWVALAPDWSRVVAIGRTWGEARRRAIAAGHPEAPAILAARDYGWRIPI